MRFTKPLKVFQLPLLVALALSPGRFDPPNAIHKTELHTAGVLAQRVSPATSSGGDDHTSCKEALMLVRQAQELRQNWQRDSLEKAISNYQQALNCFHSVQAKTDEAVALKGLGDVYFILSQFQQAKDAYSRRLTLIKELSNRGDEVQAVTDLAVTLSLVGEIQTALKKADEALILSQQAQDKRSEARALYALGTCQYFNGEQELSLKYQTKALPLAEATNDRELLAKIVLGIGYVHNDKDDLEIALTYYAQSLSEWKALGNPWGEAKALSSMGLTYILLGDRQKALEALRPTLATLRKIGDRMSEGATLNNIAYLYQSFGETEIALQYYQEAMSIYEQLGLVVGKILGLEYCGDVYAQVGKTDQALESYEQALLLTRSIKNRLMEADALNGIGSLYFKKGQRERARNIFLQSLEKYKSENHWRGQAAASNSLGYYFEVSNQKVESLDYYNQALVFAESAQDQEGISATHYNLARIEQQLGRLDNARTNLERCLSINEASRAKVASHDLKGSYLASVHKHYESYIDVLMQLHRQRPSEGFEALALQASERARARSFLESLGEGRADLRHGVDPSLLARERRLQRAINTKVQQKSRLTSTGTAQEVDTVTKELNQLTIEYHDALGEIRAKSPNYATLTRPEPLNLKRVQLEVLDNDSTLLEYSLGDERSYLWVVTRAGISSYQLAGRQEIETAARNLYNLLTATLPMPGETSEPRQARLTAANQQLPTSIAELSKLILSPVANKLENRRLLIVTDGALQYIPFQILTLQTTSKIGETANFENSEFLIADHEIVNQPSASVLGVLVDQANNRKPFSNSVAVLADPVFEADDPRLNSAITRPAGSPSTQGPETQLPQTLRDVNLSASEGRIPRLQASRDEANAITALAPWLSTFQAVGFDANRATALRADLGDYRIVHFATHAFVNDQHPELSGVVLSLFDEKGQPQDGFLRLHDIYNLKLPVDLVVLSACNTGLGKEVRGEGLIGLTRGFMYAGASSVVASLWKVDDEATAELMKLFYAALFQEGLSPAAALRKAQLEMSQQKRWQSPYFWSGFIIQGQYNQTQRPTYFSPNNQKLFAALAALLVLAAFFIWKRRRQNLL